MLKRANRTADILDTWMSFILGCWTPGTHTQFNWLLWDSTHLLQHKKFKKTKTVHFFTFSSHCTSTTSAHLQDGDTIALTFSLCVARKPPYLSRFSFFSLPPLPPIYFCNSFLMLLLPNEHVFQGKNMQLVLENKGGNVISLKTALPFIQVFDDHCVLNICLTLSSPQDPTASFVPERIWFICIWIVSIVLPKACNVCNGLSRILFAFVWPTYILLWGLS